MKAVILLVPVLILLGCVHDSETPGVEYTGEVNLNKPLRIFAATSTDQKEIKINMTGPHELTFHFNDKVSHIDYEEKVIIFRSETDKTEWTAKKVRGGFKLEDGTVIRYGKCKGWEMCLMDGSTGLPILKGEFKLSGRNGEITLWISESEKHVELLALMVNALFNRSKNEKQLNDGAFETLSPQVWTYH